MNLTFGGDFLRRSRASKNKWVLGRKYHCETRALRFNLGVELNEILA